MNTNPENKVGATHWAKLPDGSVIFYKIAEADILLWAPFSQVWISPGIVPYTLYSFDDETANVLDIIAQRDELLAALIDLAATAERCDGWSQFPQASLDTANEAIAKAAQS